MNPSFPTVAACAVEARRLSAEARTTLPTGHVEAMDRVFGYGEDGGVVRQCVSAQPRIEKLLLGSTEKSIIYVL